MNTRIAIALMAGLMLTACDDKAEREADKARSLKLVYNAGREMHEARRWADRPEATPRDHEAYRAALDRLQKRKANAAAAGVEDWKIQSESLAGSVDATKELAARTLAEAQRKDQRTKAEQAGKPK